MTAQTEYRGLPVMLSDLPEPKALLFDLDGTLYRGDERIPEADRLIGGLAERGFPHWFVTNNSSRSPNDVAEHLRRMGIPAKPEQVITSSLAAADYARAAHPGGKAYVIGESGLREALQEAGIRLLDEKDDVQADLVVQGIDRNFSYARLAAAVRHIRRGAAYILTNPDLVLPVDGDLMPGAGTIGASIQAGAGIPPVVIGKPSAILMDYTLKRAGLKAEEAWVVGDNPATDIAAASGAGCPSVLMLTGVCTADNWEDLCRSASARPNAVCAGLADLASLLSQMESRRSV